MPDSNLTKEQRTKAARSSASMVLIVLAGIVVVIASLLIVAYMLSKVAVADVLSLPIMAISGIVLLLGILAIVSISFALFGIEDPKQALGLPEGSIRAVIALSLVILFGIFSVYFYGSLTGGSVDSIGCLTDDSAKSFVQSLPRGDFVGQTKVTCAAADIRNAAEKNAGNSQLANDDTQNPPGNAGGANRSGGNGGGGGGPPSGGNGNGGGSGAEAPAPANTTVYFRTGSPEGADFAKQVTTLLGTLLTAISSFYFGSKMTSVSTGEASGTDRQTPSPKSPLTGGSTTKTSEPEVKAKPSVSGVEAPTIMAGETAEVKLSGSGFSGIDGVRITDGQASVAAKNVVASDTELTFVLSVPDHFAGRTLSVDLSRGSTAYEAVASLEIGHSYSWNQNSAAQAMKAQTQMEASGA